MSSRQTNWQKRRSTNKQINSHTKIQTNRHSDRWITDEQTDKQTEKKEDKQIDRGTDKKNYTEKAHKQINIDTGKQTNKLRDAFKIKQVQGTNRCVYAD